MEVDGCIFLVNAWKVPVWYGNMRAYLYSIICIIELRILKSITALLRRL